jgi:general secretion pathway protein D
MNKGKLLRYFIIVFFYVGLIILPDTRGLAQEENKPAEPQSGISLNLAGVKIGTLLEYISRKQGKPLLLEEKFPKEAPIEIISPPGVSIPPDKLFDVIASILRMKGFAIVSTGPMLKVVSLAKIKENPLVVSTTGEIDKLDYTDRVITQIIPLKYADATQIAQMIMPLKSTEGNVTISTDTNTLILTEFAANIRRLYEIIQQLDQEPTQYQTEIKQLKNTSVATVKTSVNEYIQAMGQTVRVRPGSSLQKPFVSIDERSNSVMVFALEKDIKQISRLIDVLDVDIPKKESVMHTYKLSNTTAEDVAKIIEPVFTKQQTALPASAKRPEDVISITAEKSTNSLIICAPPDIWTEIEKLAAEIDIRKSQVLIEAAIVELSMEKMAELGVELASTKSPGNKMSSFGATGFGLSSTDATTGRTVIQSEGVTVGLWKDTVYDIPFLLHAAQTESGINVMAVPRILTNDNNEATIDISDQIAYNTKTVGTDGTITAITFGGYVDAGIKLKITPHISPDGYIRLEIEQTVAQFGASTSTDIQPPKTNRTAKTAVTVPDKNTVIIGGLTNTTTSKTEKKVPLLSDIPLLGFLFRWSKDTTKKNNLCIFITPHIMKQFSELVEKTSENKEALEKLNSQTK